MPTAFPSLSASMVRVPFVVRSASAPDRLTPVAAVRLMLPPSVVTAFVRLIVVVVIATVVASSVPVSVVVPLPADWVSVPFRAKLDGPKVTFRASTIVRFSSSWPPTVSPPLRKISPSGLPVAFKVKVHPTALADSIESAKLIAPAAPSLPSSVSIVTSVVRIALPLAVTAPPSVRRAAPTWMFAAVSAIALPEPVVVLRSAFRSIRSLASSVMGPAECTSASTVIVSGGSMVRPCEGAVRVPLISTSLPAPLVILSR